MAGLVPAAATVMSIVSLLEPGAWLSPTAWRGLAPVALLYGTALLLVGAPVLGVLAVSRPDGQNRAAEPGRGARPAPLTGLLLTVLLSASALYVASVAAAAVVGAAAGEPLEWSMLRAPAVQALAAVTLALAGAALAAVLRNPVDAAGIGVLLAGAGSGLVLTAGPLVDQVPRRVVEWALAASPVFAVSSAANIDLLHTDVLYQISPLAHVQLQAPGWVASAIAYLATATVCLFVLHSLLNRLPTPSSLQPR